MGGGEKRRKAGDQYAGTGTGCCLSIGISPVVHPMFLDKLGFISYN